MGLRFFLFPSLELINTRFKWLVRYYVASAAEVNELKAIRQAAKIERLPLCGFNGARGAWRAFINSEGSKIKLSDFIAIELNSSYAGSTDVVEV